MTFLSNGRRIAIAIFLAAFLIFLFSSCESPVAGDNTGGTGDNTGDNSDGAATSATIVGTWISVEDYDNSAYGGGIGTNTIIEEFTTDGSWTYHRTNVESGTTNIDIMSGSYTFVDGLLTTTNDSYLYVKKSYTHVNGDYMMKDAFKLTSGTAWDGTYENVVYAKYYSDPDEIETETTSVFLFTSDFEIIDSTQIITTNGIETSSTPVAPIGFVTEFDSVGSTYRKFYFGTSLFSFYDISGGSANIIAMGDGDETTLDATTNGVYIRQ